jgi:hypothetical protein
MPSTYTNKCGGLLTLPLQWRLRCRLRATSPRRGASSREKISPAKQTPNRLNSRWIRRRASSGLRRLLQPWTTACASRRWCLMSARRWQGAASTTGACGGHLATFFSLLQNGSAVIIPDCFVQHSRGQPCPSAPPNGSQHIPAWAAAAAAAAAANVIERLSHRPVCAPRR